MADWRPANERIVITGMGAITPAGLDMASAWDSVSEGRSRIAPITLFDTEKFRVKIAGEAHGFDPLTFMTPKQARRCDRYVQMSLVAAFQAVGEAGLEIGGPSAFDVGVIIGCGAGGIHTYVEQQHILDRRGPRAISPLLIPMIVGDAGSVQVGMALGARGPNLGVSSACATGLDAIGLSLETLRRGDAKVMITGGAEAAVNELGIAGFDRLGALSRHNDDPQGAARPFDSKRDGFVLSEGSVVLVLETLEHARSRDVEPIAEIRSYAATSDAVHLTAPDTEGAGAVECMRRSLAKAQLAPQDVDYINAHAPGTPLGDPIEARAIHTLLGEGAAKTFVSSTKSTTGHLLGAAGAFAIALTACAIRDAKLPPTINLSDPDPNCNLLHVANVPKATETRTALVPSYGFGGHNSCLVLTAQS
jgi:3-oxoacyl-[acyl-carrier-protein] synthase II